MSMRKRDLEIALSKIGLHNSPRLSWEQYQTSSSVAATLLYQAETEHHDIAGRKVVDLGCGTGIFAIGASLMGAELVVGVDHDLRAVKSARGYQQELGATVEWVVGDIEAARGEFDTAVQNPPFGVRKPGSDVKFLRKALNIARIVYSIHKKSVKSRKFLESKIRALNGRITSLSEARLLIPHQFEFHRKPRRFVAVDIYRMERS